MIRVVEEPYFQQASAPQSATRPPIVGDTIVKSVGVRAIRDINLRPVRSRRNRGKQADAIAISVLQGRSSRNRYGSNAIRNINI